jgi:hypothetical protein
MCTDEAMLDRGATWVIIGVPINNVCSDEAILDRGATWVVIGGGIFFSECALMKLYWTG